jgi:uncharacterized protein with ParB-like and HNH nuclease domain
MSYHSKSISEIVNDIEFEKAFLPAIQRKFVWPTWKIEKLFDSLMRNYPIGSFLFWELKKKKAQNYVFYNFLKDYDDRSPYNKRKESSFWHEEIIGVLDGQQRLSSLYLGLQGSHRERKKHKKGWSDKSFPQRFMYLNLFSLPYYMDEKEKRKEEREIDFEFKFLTKTDAQVTERKVEKGKKEPVFWYKVGRVLDLPADPDIDTIYDAFVEEATKDYLINAFKDKRADIKFALRVLHKRVNDPLINYFKVVNSDLDDILEIFIRVNSGGTILSKTDLLFSTIVATWEDGRDEIEAFIRDINQIGDGFWFNNDFLMRCCLVLSDLQVLFKVDSFKTENVTLIKDNWEAIKTSVEKTVKLINSFGFSGQTLTSQNAVIVIAYYFMKGGNDSQSSIEGLKRYLLHALLKNIYGGQGDQVIRSLRDAIWVKIDETTYELTEKKFDFNKLLELQLPANKTLKISSSDIEKFLDYKKGTNSFFVLSLLYPNLKYAEVKFHQDHIHPDAGFSNAKMKDQGIAENLFEEYQTLKDTIPNLQLMEGTQNSSKNAKPFATWINERDGDSSKFFADNFIPTNEVRSFGNFLSFYAERKKLISDKLHQLLKVGL